MLHRPRKIGTVEVWRILKDYGLAIAAFSASPPFGGVSLCACIGLTALMRGLLFFPQEPSVQNDLLAEYKPLSGELCLAKYFENDQWYRAATKEVRDTYARVTFVDFGNEEFVRFNDIRPLPDRSFLFDFKVRPFSNRSTPGQVSNFIKCL